RNTSRCGRPEQRGFGAQKSSSREDCAKRSRDDYGAYRWRTGNFKKEPAGSRGVVQNRAGEISGSSTCAVRNGTVALLDHDGPRAKEVFGKLTTGEHPATDDPMVMAWSHVYLGRVLEDEGELERA